MLDNLYFTNAVGGAAAPKLLGLPNITTAGGVYMAKLGDYMFSLDTAAFQQLQRDTAFRWASIKRIGRAPAMQFTGLDDDTIELSGVIYPHFRGGMSQVSQMRAAAGRGEPLPLIYGFDQIGQYCGRWCIKNVREGRTSFMRDGVSKKIEFTLSLIYYGEDAGGALPVVSLLSGIEGLDTALPVPPLLGSSGDAMLASARGLSGLPTIDSSSSLADINGMASAIKVVANAASDIAGAVRATASGAIGSLTAGAMDLVPAQARGAISDLIQAAGDIDTMRRDVLAGAEVFKDSPAGIKRTGIDFGNAMKGVQRGAVVNGGIIRSAGTQLSAMPKTDGISDIDRLGAAAGLADIARAADKLTFAAAESIRQAGTIVDSINV